ncbi:MAG: dienelactone hydrolase family protein [Alphaproteobacteria bacterium]|nr:dienelactone hydrolase family protein [Pseudomonadota bacterium]TDI63358.1 MAG: dienelactone hydrolase family protein [Alphaproteobacteria bacterium]
MAYEGMIAETIRVHGHGGDLIDAYAARPLGAGPLPGVVVVHHMPGWDEWTREVVRKVAHHGFNAVAPDLHFRQGPGTPSEKAQRVRDMGGQIDAIIVDDLSGGEAYLRELQTANSKVGLIGFCSGGRVAYMAAAKMPGLDCAVDCWGGNVTAPPGKLNDNQPVAPFDMTADIAMPLLGIFGNDDKNPDPGQVDQIEAELKAHKKDYAFYRYDGAGHAFFNYAAGRYQFEQAAEGWEKVFAFFDRHLR